MGSLSAELSLDYRPHPTTFLPKTITDFISEASMISDDSLRLSKLDDLISKLQEELKKIDAFKRELPLCMLLLNDAITALKMESVQCSTQAAAKPLLKEFIPWKKNGDEEEYTQIKREKEVDSKDKKNWLSSVQLWSADDDTNNNNINKNAKQDLKLEFKKNDGKIENMLQRSKSKNGEKSFLQISACNSQTHQEKVELPVNGLSLLSPLIKNSREKSSTVGRGVSSSVNVSQSNLRNGVQQQPARKQRRCWSPELHRRFVNALQQLGGSQAATPKQIRELMQVEGLTNDEVKSHLQKYRLHTRRVPNPSTSIGKESMVVLGGLWMSQDQGGECSKANTLQSGSPEGPLQLGGSTGATSITACNSMEEDEDEKSESYGWRSHIHKPERDDV